jgi:hypothetical protein
MLGERGCLRVGQVQVERDLVAGMEVGRRAAGCKALRQRLALGIRVGLG